MFLKAKNIYLKDDENNRKYIHHNMIFRNCLYLLTTAISFKSILKTINHGKLIS